ncbi:LysM peptidoglycan-binding domain-containing protein [Blastococcus sp. LR1]|uniref:LysM peptidoglycan-binding domain-containing protein n=1 Tax=Blastococcus sp. LR1 TaxID=2877000 RepID=UPI001CCC1399|nr:LysM peptidoglycan-binding domain-containing protein [Blastococcus sp. LR1]MCA0146652.1 LysM peptidoglycan-binding domain-containing protein [Blastococcus sp. LR1]
MNRQVEGEAAMTSNTALVVPEVPVGMDAAPGGRPAAPVRAERHLRVLPPPVSYVVAAGAAPRQPAPDRARPGVRHVPAPRLRLTSRGRRLVVVLALALGVGGVALGDALMGGDGKGLELMGSSSVVVERGDTLWAIAGSVAGDGDVREVVAEIVELNSLEGGAIEPGQVLQLP